MLGSGLQSWQGSIKPQIIKKVLDPDAIRSPKLANQAQLDGSWRDWWYQKNICLQRLLRSVADMLGQSSQCRTCLCLSVREECYQTRGILLDTEARIKHPILSQLIGKMALVRIFVSKTRELTIKKLTLKQKTIQTLMQIRPRIC